MALPVEQERPVAEPAVERPEARPGRLARIRGGLPRTGLAVLCGLLLAAAFPPYDLWPLSILAVAGLSLLTRGRTARQGAWTGFAFGLPFFLWLLSWLRVIGLDATIGLSVVEALFIAALGAGLAATSRLRAWPLWAACLWVTQEWARDRLPLGGFPWGRLAFANTASPSPRSPPSAAPRWSPSPSPSPPLCSPGPPRACAARAGPPGPPPWPAPEPSRPCSPGTSSRCPRRPPTPSRSR